MKKLQNLFFLLFLVFGVSYYFYKTNTDVHSYLSQLIEPYNKNTDTLTSSSFKNKISKKRKKKIPKALKPDAFYTLDTYARKAPKQYERNISTLAQYLIKPAHSDIEKARVLFTWIATHIKYDDNAFNSGVYPNYSAENVLLNKRAVCEGYSNILNALCASAGLKSDKIIGYAKGYGYMPGDKISESDHAWNVIKIDNQWRLFDATWASGYGTNKNEKLVSTSKFAPYWFDVHPKAFIFTHLPEQNEWQLTGSSLSLAQYETLPYLRNDFFELGFNPDTTYTEAVTGSVKEFVDAYSMNFPIDASHLPNTLKLSGEKEIIFKIESNYAEELVLIDDNTYHSFYKDGTAFTLSHKPTGKGIMICVKINWFDKNYTPIAVYKVIHKNKIATVASN
jgi:hypothetical protein